MRRGNVASAFVMFVVLAVAASPTALAAADTAPTQRPDTPDRPETVVLCHKPGTEDEASLRLPEGAKLIEKHLSHGDTLGECDQSPPHDDCEAPESPSAPSSTTEPEDEQEWISAASLTLSDFSEEGLNPANTPVSLGLSCPTLDEASVAVYVDDAPLDASAYSTAPDSITINSGLTEGRHKVRILARDIFGFTLSTTHVLWFGLGQAVVRVLAESGAPAGGVAVTLTLADDNAVTATGITDGSGQVLFKHLPDRTYGVIAKSDSNDAAYAAFILADSPVTLEVTSLGPASQIDNNDFSSGLEGWNTGTAPVALIPHVEGALPDAPTAPEQDLAPVAAATDSALLAASSDDASDMDLALSTSGEGAQRVSRTFEVEPGTKSVAVRYRFITSEVPEWFGSQYNDYFSVGIRSSKGGGFVNAANSMNGLGLGAFDGGGATQWYEEELRVSEEGDTVQVDLTVANVADDLLDSSIVVDLVKEKKLAITALSLNDIDNQALSYISLDSHSYFSGQTRVHGTITIEGDKEDSLKELELQVLNGGSIIARGGLEGSLAGSVYRVFGDTEKIEINTSQLLFNIPAGQVNASGQVSLRVHARSADETADRDFGALQALKRYAGSNRFGERDDARGGDDWVRPSVKSFLEGVSGVIWNDMSNMHGGDFTPDHKSHRHGLSADGHFANYNKRDATTAKTIIAQLNNAGTRVTTVYVTFTPEFSKAIQGVKLNDGRLATSVIRNLNGHKTHFHWEVS
jgi:hypothetical protein